MRHTVHRCPASVPLCPIAKGRPHADALLSVSILVCVIVEVTLNINERGSLVAGAGGQVTQGAEQVCQSSRCCALGRHLSDQIAVLFADCLFNRAFQLVTSELAEIVVRQIFEL